MGNFKLSSFKILALYDKVIWAPWRETGGTIIGISMPGLCPQLRYDTAVWYIRNSSGLSFTSSDFTWFQWGAKLKDKLSFPKTSQPAVYQVGECVVSYAQLTRYCFNIIKPTLRVVQLYTCIAFVFFLVFHTIPKLAAATMWALAFLQVQCENITANAQSRDEIIDSL